jgi:hypothetical protein
MAILNLEAGGKHSYHCVLKGYEATFASLHNLLSLSISPPIC